MKLPLLYVKQTITRAWWHLPLTRENKERVKDVLFTLIPVIFRHSKVYRNWKEARKWTIGIEQRLAMEPEGRVRKIDSASFSALKYQPEPPPPEPIAKVAVIVHVFHFEIFLEIMENFQNKDAPNLGFFITCPIEMCDMVTTYFKRKSYDYQVMPVDNRGRDILPFLKVIPQVFSSGYQVILKIHTKKSNHRRTGELWRKDLYNKLLRDETIDKILDIFNKNPTVGLIGAQGHIVPMNLYYGANAARIELLSREMGVASTELMTMHFPAGSMFYVRKQALYPLLNLDLKSEDFDEETGQLDGTLAHAVERAFAISAHAAGYKLADTSFKPEIPALQVTKDHPFTY